MIVFPQDEQGTGWTGGQVYSEPWGYARGWNPGIKFFDQVQKYQHSKFRIWVEQLRAKNKEETKVEVLGQLLPMELECTFIGRVDVDGPIWFKTSGARLETDCLCSWNILLCWLILKTSFGYYV